MTDSQPVATPALVLLPGMDGSGLLFAPFVAALGSEAGVQIIHYPPTQPLDYVALEALVRAQLPERQPFVLLGESFSGPLAISIAADPPAAMSGLALCCTFACNPRPWLGAFHPLLNWLPVRAAPSFAMHRLLMGRHGTPALRAALQQGMSPVSHEVWCTRLRAVAQAQVQHKLRRVRMPTLVLSARHDALVPARATQMLLTHCPHAQHHALDGPHFLLQTQPAQAAQIVSAFVRSCR